MAKVKVVIENKQKTVKVPTGMRMLMRRCCTAVLENEHFGLDKVKQRVLEYLAIRALNPEGRSPILCLVGAPGVGKTSVASSIARALGRPEIMHEVSDLTHFSKTVRGVCDRFAGVLDEHLAGTRTKTGPGPELKRESVNNSGWAVSTLQAALWAFNTTETFEDGLIAAVNLGGDADSIGAVYGQVAGAYYGFDAIPERWVKAVKMWEAVDALSEKFLKAIERE